MELSQWLEAYKDHLLVRYDQLITILKYADQLQKDLSVALVGRSDSQSSEEFTE